MVLVDFYKNNRLNALLRENSIMSNTKKIIIKINSNLKELVPKFIQNREKDAQSISKNIEEYNFERIQNTANSMKDTSAGYGFSEITKLGIEIEDSAKNQDIDRIKKLVTALSHYLDNIEVKFTE